MKIAAVFVVLLPCVGLADPLPSAVNMADIIAAVAPNWNSAGAFKAVLVRDPDDASLYLFDDPFDEIPAAVLPQIVFSGSMWGQIPWLEFDEGGALLVNSENMSVGRNRWQQTITIKRQNSGYFVTGYSYSAYDALDLDYSLDCTIDFETGSANRDGEILIMHENIPPVPVESWGGSYFRGCFQESD